MFTCNNIVKAQITNIVKALVTNIVKAQMRSLGCDLVTLKVLLLEYTQAMFEVM